MPDKSSTDRSVRLGVSPSATLHVVPDSAGYRTIDIGDDLDQLKAAYPAQAQIIDRLSRAG